ncbi:hypothetical protein MCAG_02722 [Micromonospora sp. ATCC 39149]|uniref:DUF5666 domain-containing protein n=1 Tax=Micromonospora carbonacea TaxID=47853 RepID=A0A7D5Y848_9ACTN|nr:hypothetical protein [Micromonospora sp. ATCC 39149]EEP72395.1 hypothetical protein MCAG_02722 [Micromonospora sp. ATCC 39149]QLJ98541.1 hypothetical protein HZU44_28520 [Micromonospora carbonacea]
MARQGIAIVATSLLAAVALGVTGCGPAQVAQGAGKEIAVDVSAALGAEGQALAALGFDAGDLDLVAAPAPAGSATPAPATGEAGAKDRRGERAEQWRKRRQARVLLRKNALHGEVTAIDGDSMTVKSTDGFTMTWTFGGGLRVVERRTTVQPEAVRVGATVGIAGAKDGDAATARLILLK